MKNLETLINELCPEGVEFQTMEEIFEIRNGYTPSKNNPDFWENGTIPWFRMEDIRQNGRILSDAIQHITPAAIKGKGLFPVNSIIIATTATIGEHALVIADSLANQRFTNLTVRKSLTDRLLPKFVFYYMFVIDEWCKKNVNAGNFASVDMKRFKKIEFPLPPIEVQNEIVRILDKFTSLEAELEAELDCRKRQYEYYRDKLLSFNNVGGQEVEWKTLGELAEIGTGSSNTKDGLSEGLYPFYTRGQEVLRKNEYEFDDEAIITAGDGVGVGKVIHYVKGKYALHQRAYRFKPGDLLNARFLYFYMTSTFYKYVCGNSVSSSVSSLRKPRLLKYPIPLLPMQEQIRIVSILDRFESLTTSLTEGLPAEIAARRQQYEHYRDKLLTFKRKITA